MTTTTDTGKCGTYAGHQRHRRRNEPPCDACRDGRNAYRRRYHREANAARGRARYQASKPYKVKSPRTQANILDLLDMYGPMTTPRIVDEMSHLGVGTFWSVRRAVYRLRDKGLVERVGTAAGGPFGTSDVAVWGLTDEGRSW